MPTNATSTPRRAPNLDALREQLAAAKHAERGSFARVQARFLDLTEDPAFFDASRAVASPEIEAIVHAAVATIFPRTGDAALPIAIHRYGETGFYHGAFFTPEGIGAFFWFDDHGQGLVSVERLDGRGCDVRIRRPVVLTTTREGHPPFTMRAPEGIH
jgi:hypothetical protein